MKSNTPSEPVEPQDPSGQPRWLHVALLLALTAIIFHGVLGFGFFPHWDDALYLVDRPEVADWFAASWVQRLLTPEVGYPIPLPSFLYYLLRQLSSEWVVPAAHLLSLAFHLINVVFVYILASRWLGDARLGGAAAGLWAAHPLLVESVAWATNLKTVTLATFLLGSLWVWDHHIVEPDWKRAAGAVLLFLLALGCRPEAVIAAPLWGCIALWRDPQSWRQRAVWAPVLLVAAISALFVPVGILGHDQLLLSASQVEQVSLADRFWRMGAALGLQLRHVFWPVDLHPSYLPNYAGAIREVVLGGAAVVALITATLWGARKRSPAVAGLSLFWLAYLPASGVTYLPRFTADTYMYLPLAGLMIALVAAAAHLMRAVGPRLARYGGLIAAVAIVFFGALSYAQTLRWTNEISLWRPTIDAYPNNPQAYWMVGAAYVSVQQWEKAAEVYREGYPHFEQRQRIPVQMVLALREVGDTQRAAQVAATIATYDGPGGRHAALLLLELLALDSVHLKDDSVLVEALDEIIAAGLDTISVDETRLDASGATFVASKALEADKPRAAAALLSYALDVDRTNCSTWSLIQTLDSVTARTIAGRSEPPDVCTD